MLCQECGTWQAGHPCMSWMSSEWSLHSLIAFGKDHTPYAGQLHQITKDIHWPNSLTKPVLTPAQSLLWPEYLVRQRPRQLQQLLFSYSKEEWQPQDILELRRLNWALITQTFRMLSLKQIILQVCLGDCFFSVDFISTLFPSQTILEIHHLGGLPNTQ